MVTKPASLDFRQLTGGPRTTEEMMRGHIENRERQWRRWTAAQMLRAGRAFDFFTLAVLRSEDVVARTRQFYTDPRNVAAFANNGSRSLSPYERAYVERFTSGAGAALVLGCGGGREAIALASLGWQVVGVDGSPALVEAAQGNAAQSGVRVHWLCEDLSGGFALGRAFDLICLFGHVYSLIPGRAQRIRLLRACRQHLKPDGVCLLDFPLDGQASAQARWAHRWRRRLAWLVRGNREVQLGDRWTAGELLFIHRFASVEDISNEAAAAGFDLEAQNDGSPIPMAVLRPAATTPASSTVPVGSVTSL